MVLKDKLEMDKKMLFKMLKNVDFMPKNELEVFVDLLDEAAVQNFLKLYS